MIQRLHRSKEFKNKEWSGICRVNKDMQVIDVFFPKQKNSASSTEMTDYKEIFDFVMSQPDDEIIEWCLWLHSHHTMKTFWSGVDTNQMKSFGTDRYCKHMFHIVTSTNLTDNDIVLGMSFLGALTMHAGSETFLYRVPVTFFDDIGLEENGQERINLENDEINKKNQKILDAAQPIDPESLQYYAENANDIVETVAPKLHDLIESISEKEMIQIAYDLRKEWIDGKTTQLVEKDEKVVYTGYNYRDTTWDNKTQAKSKTNRYSSNQATIFGGKGKSWNDEDDDYYPYGGRVQPHNPPAPAVKENEDEWYTQHNWRVNNSGVVQQYSILKGAWITMDYEGEEVMCIDPITGKKVTPHSVGIYSYD